MTSQLLEAPPVLTREDIVNMVLENLRAKVESNRTRLEKERAALREPSSETDRDELAEHRRLAMDTITNHEVDTANSLAFISWLERQRRNEVALTPGNVWVLDSEVERAIWVIYDPKAVRPGMEVYVTLGDSGLQRQLEVDFIGTLSVGCPLYEMLLKGEPPSEGEKVAGGIQKNPIIYRLTQVL